MTARGAISPECATAAPVLSRYDYEYDPNRQPDPPGGAALGNRDAGARPGRETTYGYDDLDRLVGVKSPDDTAVLYDLDPVGNRRGERRAAALKVAALTVAAFAALAPADALAE